MTVHGAIMQCREHDFQYGPYRRAKRKNVQFKLDERYTPLADRLSLKTNGRIRFKRFTLGYQRHLF